MEPLKGITLARVERKALTIETTLLHALNHIMSAFRCPRITAKDFFYVNIEYSFLWFPP